MNNETNKCELCNRKMILTIHHLIPKAIHKKQWTKKHFKKIELRENVIKICEDCHKFIHQQFPMKVIGKELNSKEKLMKNQLIDNFIKFAAKQKNRIYRGE